ncbi:hypothetical protein R1sor_013040 [Riccia sorocarpa]|uniref:Uncharacterized protein n=1 Tax=Riccia sorocarpa TaxID=122646 RepID=A0ABD3H7E1_9MARC
MSESSDISENTGDSQPADVVGKGKGRRPRGRTVNKAISPSVKTRAQAKRQAKRLSNDTMSIDSGHPSDFRRSLWKDDCSEPKSKQSACASIIDKYRMDFKGKEPPRIPLCRLEVLTRVRKLQLSSSQAEDLKRSFRLNGTSHATVQYDWIQDAERTLQVLSTPLFEYKVLLGEKVYSELEEFRKKTATKGWYSDNMTVAAGAFIMSFSEVMAAQKELVSMEKDMEANGKPWSESKKNKRWKEMLTDATRHWHSLIQKYATIVNPSLGPEFMSTVRELQTTLAQQDKGKKEIKVEVGVNRIKAFASASIPRDLKIKLLRVHYCSDPAVRVSFHHPSGNDLDNDIRPWLHQWAMWAMLETYCLNMLSACVAIQGAEAIRGGLKAASGDPDSIPTLTADLKLAEEKLPHVYDPRKLQNLFDDDCLEKAKALEPRADQVVTTFTKLKRKKEELTPKTPIVEIHPEQAEEIPTPTDGLTCNRHFTSCLDASEGRGPTSAMPSLFFHFLKYVASFANSTPIPRRSARKPRKKKDADDEPSTEPRQEPSTTATTGPVEVEVNDEPVVQPEPTQEIRNSKRLKKKPAEAKPPPPQHEIDRMSPAPPWEDG